MLLPLLLAIEFGESDADLVRRLQRRDPRAMAELYDRYGRLVYALIVRVVRDGGIAEDLVQETFLRVWNRVQGFDAERGGLGPWLLAVARNRAIDYLRSAAGRMRNAVELPETEHPALFADMEKELLNSDRVRRVRVAPRWRSFPRTIVRSSSWPTSKASRKPRWRREWVSRWAP